MARRSISRVACELVIDFLCALKLKYAEDSGTINASGIVGSAN